MAFRQFVKSVPSPPVEVYPLLVPVGGACLFAGYHMYHKLSVDPGTWAVGQKDPHLRENVPQDVRMFQNLNGEKFDSKMGGKQAKHY